MKRFIKVIYALLVFAVAAGMCSCEKEETTYLGGIVEDGHQDISYLGGVVTVQIISNTDWEVIDKYIEYGYQESYLRKDITVSPMSGTGNGVITIDVGTNQTNSKGYMYVRIRRKDGIYKDIIHSQAANPYEIERHTASDLYISIVGFNDKLYIFRQYNSWYNFVSISYSGQMQSFINSLSAAPGTILYYIVDEAIEYLQISVFPDDLNNAAIVTFTDGLDQGSSAMNPSYDSASAYLSAINSRLKKAKVNGTTNISAYTIGLKGNDVMDDAQFKQNLKGLASSDANAFEVANMSEVNAKFSEIASSLYNESTSQSLTLTIPQPYNNTKVRFTFDIPDGGSAASSKYYIEGTYNSDALTDIRYEGLTSSSGNRVAVSSKNGVNVSFKFSDIKFKNGFSPVISDIKQWSSISGTNQWQINSEFNPDSSVDKTTERKSAAIMLLLDCSSSLGSNIEYVKSAAVEFIDILYQAYNNK